MYECNPDEGLNLTDFSGFCSWAEETFFIRYEGGDLFNQHPCSSVGLDVCLFEECTLEVPIQSLVFTRGSPSTRVCPEIQVSLFADWLVKETSEVCRYTNISIYYTKKSQAEPQPVACCCCFF